ncbi:MAG: sulfatase-like hydrolase/transferase [Anaerolineales bacterium]|nr:sulfatase-like hydrolase/transferase [Anaerolineales bacterium]
MASRDPGRPNILIILADDQGYWALGSAGNDEIHTPNLDRMATEGMRFENFFCVSPVCSPARASILTGRIPSQHGVHDWLRRGNLKAKTPGGSIDDRSIEYLEGLPGYSDVLSENGYVCGLSGKWHLGDSIRPQKGFTYWHIFPWGESHYYNAQMIRNGKVERDDGYITDVINDGGIKFLEEQSRSKDPFYLGVHFTAPHAPWDSGQHPEDLVALYDGCHFQSCPDLPEAHPWQINTTVRGRGSRRRELLSGYFAAVTGIDRSVGRLMLKLDELGLRENTLVFYSSDNGMNMGHHGIWGKGNGTFPQNMFDTSVKVPMIISMPGRLPENVVIDHLLSHYDLMPTLLDYVGFEIPGADALPGRSFTPLLEGREIQERDSVVVFDEYGPVRMIRSREWKYVHRYPFGPHELYDLIIDPNEDINLVDSTHHAGEVENLKAQLEAWFIRYVNPHVDGVKEPVTGKGQLGLAGTAACGRKAFGDEWWYIDADGERRA